MDGEQSTGTFPTIRGVVPNSLAGLSIVVLVGGAGFLAWQVFGKTGATDTLRFIALLIMLMVALAATASLFVWLRLGSRDEAFGLPSGSIRALLALGIMMLFVVFGMPVITAQGDLPPAVESSMPRGLLAEAIRSNREQGFYVQVLDPGADAVPPGQARDARIRILGRVPTQTAGQLDLTKQLLTAIITLLTTVIGFYFGTRSATDAMRDAAQPAPPAPAPADQRRQLVEAFTPVKDEIDADAATIERWKADPTTPGNAERTAALASVAPQRADLEQKRDAISRALTAADTALAAAAAATTGEDRTRQETAARGHLRAAADLLALTRAALVPYSAAVRAIR